MTVHFRNREDTRRYVAAEDAFTSEGGYPAQDGEALGKDADLEIGQLSRVFRKAVDRYAAEMRHVLTVVRGGGAHPATRTTNPQAR